MGTNSSWAWRALLLVALASVVTAQLVVTPTTRLLYNFGFETGAVNPGFTLYADSAIRYTAAWTSTTAARTGSTGARFDVSVASPGNGWKLQLKPPNQALVPDSVYSFCIWSKVTGVAKFTTAISISNNANGANVAWKTFDLTSTWSRLCLHDVQVKTAITGSFGIFMGDVANITVYYDDASFVSDQLDLTFSEPDKVNARIEQIRKGDLTVQMVDSCGNTLTPGRLTSLNANLARHDFAFGTSMDSLSVAVADRTWYKNTAAGFFNALVPENSFKWPSYEPTQGSTKYTEIANEYTNFAVSNDFVLARGHTLEWWVAMYNNHYSRASGCTNYRSYVKTHIQREVASFMGKFNHYDVINEPLHERGYADTCNLWGDVFYDAYRWAAAADPTAKLCVNDYNVLGGGNGQNQWREFHELISGMLAAKVPVHCLGLQAYLTPGQVTPEMMDFRLKALGSLGLQTLVTEYLFYTDWPFGSTPVNNMNDTTFTQFYTNYTSWWFSHPNVDGILMWGFWDSLLWVQKGGLYRADKSLKPAGQAYKNLLSVTWNTSVTASAGQLSAFPSSLAFRGFYGKYRVRGTTKDGQSFNVVVNFPKSAGPTQSSLVVLPISCPVVTPTPTTAPVATTVYTGTFDTNYSGFAVSATTDTTNGPVSSNRAADPAAARTGAGGVSVTVTKASTSSWLVQLQAPTSAKLLANKTYKFCIWGRLESGGPVGVSMSLKDPGAGYANVATSGIVQMSTTWSQLCLTSVVPYDMNGQYMINLAQNVATYYFDDAIVTYT